MKENHDGLTPKFIKLYFRALISLLTETANNASYKFEAPEEKDDGSLQHALWAAQPKPGPPVPKAKTQTY